MFLLALLFDSMKVFVVVQVASCTGLYGTKVIIHGFDVVLVMSTGTVHVLEQHAYDGVLVRHYEILNNLEHGFLFYSDFDVCGVEGGGKLKI